MEELEDKTKILIEKNNLYRHNLLKYDKIKKHQNKSIIKTKNIRNNSSEKISKIASSNAQINKSMNNSFENKTMFKSLNTSLNENLNSEKKNKKVTL